MIIHTFKTKQGITVHIDDEFMQDSKIIESPNFIITKEYVEEDPEDLRYQVENKIGKVTNIEWDFVARDISSIKLIGEALIEQFVKSINYFRSKNLELKCI